MTITVSQVCQAICLLSLCVIALPALVMSAYAVSKVNAASPSPSPHVGPLHFISPSPPPLLNYGTCTHRVDDCAKLSPTACQTLTFHAGNSGCFFESCGQKTLSRADCAKQETDRDCGNVNYHDDTIQDLRQCYWHDTQNKCSDDKNGMSCRAASCNAGRICG